MRIKGNRHLARKKKHYTIRKVVRGTAERPRVSVYKSLRHLYAQLIDDERSVTLCAFSTLAKDFKPADRKKNMTEQAKAVGKQLALTAKEKGIKTVVFDRSGYKYHGNIKALAEAVRKEGLVF